MNEFDPKKSNIEEQSGTAGPSPIPRQTTAGPPAMRTRCLTMFHNRGTAWTVLAVSLLLTGLAWHLTNLHVGKRNHDRFSFRTTQIKERIEERMLEHEQVLRGGTGLFRASQEVDREEWHKYVQQIEIDTYFPGIQAMAISLAISKEDLATHIEKIRLEGFADYQITPEGERDAYSSIVFIEPFDWRNQRAFGYDMYSHPIRRKAMDRAVETGKPSISGKITLIQETNSDVQAGVLCYLPLYQSGADLSTIESRKSALYGWAYAALRMDDLLQGIIGKSVTDVRFKIYDSAEASDENLLFDSSQGTYLSQADSVSGYLEEILIEVSGRQWTLEFEATPEFIDAEESATGLLVASIGLLVDVLLFVVISTIGRQRAVATRLAEQMTKDMQESESRMRSIVENASEAIITVHADGKIAAANEASRLMFDAEGSLVGSLFNDLLVQKTLQDMVQLTAEPLSQEHGIATQGRRRDGSAFPCRMSVACVDNSFIVIARDESARVEAEKVIADSNKQLIIASHSAGRAEVATGVLHNVGNVLNSVNISATLLREHINSSPVGHLSKASDVIAEHQNDLSSFLVSDKRGQHFPQLLKQIALGFVEDRRAQLEELDSLTKNIDHIKEIVSRQQSFATKGGMIESIDPRELFEDAIRMNDSSLRRHNIRIVRHFDPVPVIQTHPHDVLQILINLIRNALQSLGESDGLDKTIWLTTETVEEAVRFEVRDSGLGIPIENLDKIFRHGFTTKNSGHGFGLHSCANSAQKMGGSLTVASDGSGKGATFTLELPTAEVSLCSI